MKQIIKPLIITTVVMSLGACTAITDITSSTSSTLDAVTPDITLNNFIDSRFDAIRRDAATGGGENINALAQLMGKKDPQAFANWMQVNYDEIFSDAKGPADLIAKIERHENRLKG
jgi:hypothetical protein